MQKFSEGDSLIGIAERPKYNGTWVKFATIGETVQGTFVDLIYYKKDEQVKVMGMDGKLTFATTKIDTHFYVLRQEDGTHKFINEKKIIDKQMQQAEVKFGQIVEFKYTGDKPSADPKYSPTKLIAVYANKEVVDREWLENNKAKAAMYPYKKQEQEEEDIEVSEGQSPATTAEQSGADGIKINELPGVSTGQENHPFPDVTEEQQIMQLATQKLGTNSGMSQKEVEGIIMINTGIVYLAANFSKIIEKLKSMPNK